MKIADTGKNRVSEYRIFVYADHLSFPGKWFLYSKMKEMNKMEKDLVFVRPSEEYFSELKAYKKEFLDRGDSMDGCGPLRRYDDMQEYLAMVNRYLNPDTLPEGLVVASQFLCIRKNDGRLVGMIQVRHYFNEFLEKYAGHIGYSVRPSERRKGYASWMLKNIKPFCRSIDLDKILVCCLDNNEGSRKTILKNGGIYDGTVFCEEEEVYLERYWIDLTKVGKEG
ncbi:MAG: GNAT family N-acetyltransferase [Acetatifactor sp.]